MKRVRQQVVCKKVGWVEPSRPTTNVNNIPWASKTRPTLRPDRSSRRRGFSLIELMVVIAIVSVIFSLVGAVFQRLFLSEQSALRAALIERTVSRLSEQFRRDVHVATDATRDGSLQAETTTLSLSRLSDTSGKNALEASAIPPGSVVYVLRPNEVIREQRAADAKVTQREVYRLPDCRVSFPEPTEADGVPFVSLAIERQYSTITPQPQSARPYRTLVVEAALARDITLATSLTAKQPAVTKEESP